LGRSPNGCCLSWASASEGHAVDLAGCDWGAPQRRTESNWKWQLKALKELQRKLPKATESVRLKPASLPARARQIKENEAQELIAAYQTGATVYQLARRFGLSRQTISKILHQRGIEMRMTGLSPAEVDEAVRLYADGWSLARIGRRLSVSPETIRLRLIEQGVQLRPRPGR
jgi:transposase-like protein